MKLRYFNPTIKEMEEREVIAEGGIAYYVKHGEGLKAIPKEDVASKICLKEDTKLISIFEYIKIHGRNIKFIDFGLWGFNA